MDALAAELLSYRGRAADGPKPPDKTNGGSNGGLGRAGKKGKRKEVDIGEEEDGEAHGAGIPFVRIDGSHDSAQVCVCVLH